MINKEFLIFVEKLDVKYQSVEVAWYKNYSAWCFGWGGLSLVFYKEAWRLHFQDFDKYYLLEITVILTIIGILLRAYIANILIKFVYINMWSKQKLILIKLTLKDFIIIIIISFIFLYYFC